MSVLEFHIMVINTIRRHAYIYVSVTILYIVNEILHKMRFIHLKQAVRVTEDTTVGTGISNSCRVQRLQALRRRRQRRLC